MRDCSRKFVTQTELCNALRIDECTLQRLKKKHPEIQQAQDEGRYQLKKDLAGALYKKAMGYETVEETQDIEDGGKGERQKRKIHRVKKFVGPDYRSIVYLLTKTFGREFSEGYESIQVMEKKLQEAKEEWIKNGYEDEVTSCDEADRDN